MNVRQGSVHYRTNLSNQNRAFANRNNVNFGAKLDDIKTETDKAFAEKKLCPGKTRFITSLTEFFDSIKEKLPENFEFKLGQKNDLSSEIKGLKGNFGGKTITLNELDNVLNKNAFKCGPEATCSCGKGMSTGDFISLLFSRVLKLDNPNKIEINR